MTQGSKIKAPKASSSGSGSGTASGRKGRSGASRKAVGTTKPGVRTVAPKKASAVREATQMKRLTSNSTRTIERAMASRASGTGKLTIMKKEADAGEDNLKTKAKERKAKPVSKAAAAAVVGGKKT